MSKILVNIVSDQTFPNIIFIKILENEQDNFDQYWFVTTEYIETKNRSNWIIATCEIPSGKVKKILVRKDDLNNIKSELEKKVNDIPNAEYIVNITGGTKIMSLGTYLIFNSLTEEIYYTPEGTSFININNETIKPSYSLSISEYLLGYGINFQAQKVTRSLDECKDFYTYFISDDSDPKTISTLRQKKYRKKGLIFNAIDGKLSENLKKLINCSGFKQETSEKLNKKEVQFLTGGWFEDYVYHKIKDTLNLEESSILSGIHIKKSDSTNENEIDIMVIKNNKLIVIECKTSMVSKEKEGKITNLFNETVYKSSALRQNFGLLVSSYIFTLEDLSDPNLKERARILGVKIVDKNILMSESAFKDEIEKM